MRMSQEAHVNSAEGGLRSLFRKGSTDIWITLGPALNGGSSEMTPKSTEMMVEVINAGAYGVRATFCDGTRELQPILASAVRNASSIANKAVVIIADLQGEKMRLGKFPIEKIDLKNGETLTLVSKSREFDEKQRIIPVAANSYSFFERVSAGDEIVIGDGSALRITKNGNNDCVDCKAIGNVTLQSYRGIAIRSRSFQPSSMTDQDKKDLEAIASAGVYDAVALSFVSGQEDVVRAKELVGEIPIIAKIETEEGVEKIQEILKVSDAVMVARGDLALYAPWYGLGNHVKRVVAAAKENQKNWIMATQLATGLERYAFPTRAEICDLTHWIGEGVSAVMLGDETAFGSKPLESVSSVKQIIDVVRREESDIVESVANVVRDGTREQCLA